MLCMYGCVHSTWKGLPKPAKPSLISNTENSLIQNSDVQTLVIYLLDNVFHAGDVLTEFFKLCCRKESTEEVLGRGLADDEGKGQL